MSKTRYCDFSCEHASFPPEEMLGACRTMSGVLCAKLGRMVRKHAPCAAEAPGKGADPGGETIEEGK